MVVNFAPSATGQTMLIDFGVLTEQTTTPGTWNNVIGATDNIADLLDNSGATTGIAMNISSGNFSGVNNFNGNVNADSAMFDAFEAATVITDGVFTSSTASGTLAFSGLDSSKIYELTITGARSEDRERFTRYSVSGFGTQTLQTSGNNPAAGTGLVNWNNDDFVTIAGITGVTFFNLTLEGNAAFDFTGSSTFGYVNALQLAVIPEPSSYALIAGLFGLAAIMVRRRK